MQKEGFDWLAVCIFILVLIDCFLISMFILSKTSFLYNYNEGIWTLFFKSCFFVTIPLLIFIVIYCQFWKIERFIRNKYSLKREMK